MSKRIAIQTILLLVLGVIVAGVLIFLVYIYSKTATLTEAECRSRANNLCMHCKHADWGTWPDTSDPDFGTINRRFYQPLWDCAEKFPKYDGFSNTGTWTCTRMYDECIKLGFR